MISARSVSSLLMLAALGAMALLVAVTVGSVSMTLSELWLAIGGGGDPLFRELVFSLRLPRALAAFATGGLLALAGALMQVLLRNPLADPYILGGGGAAKANGKRQPGKKFQFHFLSPGVELILCSGNVKFHCPTC